MVTLKFRIVLLSLILVQGIEMSGQSNAIIVLATEQSRFDAMINRDTAVLERLLSDDLVYIHSNALQENKRAHIRSIASGKIIYQCMSRSDNVVRFYGKTAINTGAINAKGIISSNPFDLKMLYTAVYRKKKQGWQLVNWQTTRFP